MFERIYASSWHHPYAFWAVGVPLLLALGARTWASGRRELGALLVAMQLLILTDAWLTAPNLSPLTGTAAVVAAIAFVVIGDMRFFLLLERFGRGRPLAIALPVAFAWSLIVPMLSQLIHASDARRLFFGYEAMFAGLAVLLRLFLVPQLDGEPRRWTARLCEYELAQYVLWAAADAVILSGRDAGFLLRLVPNAMYYVGFVPFAWRTAPKELRP